MPELSREDVISYLEKASLMEISELVKDIEEKFGIEVLPLSGCCVPPTPQWQSAHFFLKVRSPPPGLKPGGT